VGTSSTKKGPDAKLCPDPDDVIDDKIVSPGIKPWFDVKVARIFAIAE
jgi:hypothetical protein